MKGFLMTGQRRSMRITIDVETERQVTDMAIKGAVLGDILGAQYEFDRPKNLDWKNVPLTIGDAIGFTDDSVMALAIKKALVEGKDLVETMVRASKRSTITFLSSTQRLIMSTALLTALMRFALAISGTRAARVQYLQP